MANLIVTFKPQPVSVLLTKLGINWISQKKRVYEDVTTFDTVCGKLRIQTNVGFAIIDDASVESVEWMITNPNEVVPKIHLGSARVIPPRDSLMRM